MAAALSFLPLPSAGLVPSSLQLHEAPPGSCSRFCPRGIYMVELERLGFRVKVQVADVPATWHDLQICVMAQGPSTQTPELRTPIHFPQTWAPLSAPSLSFIWNLGNPLCPPWPLGGSR